MKLLLVLLNIYRIVAPVLQTQPSGPKSEASYKVEVRKYNGRRLRSPKFGARVIFKAFMTRKNLII